MYRNRLYIDGEDVYLIYGAFVAGDLKDFVCFPPMKKVNANEWPEEDGSDVDLSANVYHTDIRDITLQFGFHGPAKDETGFIEMLSDGAYHTFHFKPFADSVYALRPALRLVSNTKMDDKGDGRLGLLTFKFCDDAFGYVSPVTVVPPSTIPADGSYRLNDIRFTDFNVNILKGTLDNIRKMSDVKPNLVVNQAASDGQYYDSADVYFKSRDVKVNCLLRASGADAFWRYHQRLFSELRKPGGHRLYVGVTETEYPCYYKNCSVTEFHTEIGGVVWMKFTLTFTLTGNLRKDVLSGDLLATESGDFIVTEEGAYINMRTTVKQW